MGIQATAEITKPSRGQTKTRVCYTIDRELLDDFKGWCGDNRKKGSSIVEALIRFHMRKIAPRVKP